MHWYVVSCIDARDVLLIDTISIAKSVVSNIFPLFTHLPIEFDRNSPKHLSLELPTLVSKKKNDRRSLSKVLERIRKVGGQKLSVPSKKGYYTS